MLKMLSVLSAFRCYRISTSFLFFVVAENTFWILVPQVVHCHAVANGVGSHLEGNISDLGYRELGINPLASVALLFRTISFHNKPLLLAIVGRVVLSALLFSQIWNHPDVLHTCISGNGGSKTPVSTSTRVVSQKWLGEHNTGLGGLNRCKPWGQNIILDFVFSTVHISQLKLFTRHMGMPLWHVHVWIQGILDDMDVDPVPSGGNKGKKDNSDIATWVRNSVLLWMMACFPFHKQHFQQCPIATEAKLCDTL